MPNDALLDLTIAELAPRIASREVSPVEVTEAALARADRLQPSLNSFINLLHERAMDRARELEAELAGREDPRAPPRHSHRHQGQYRDPGNTLHRWLPGPGR